MTDLPRVTDHAVLRYLERAHGVPVEDIRKMLANSAATAIAHQAPVVVLGKIKIVMRDGVAVTVLRRSMPTKGSERRPSPPKDEGERGG